jgi:hypothetical protein
MRTWHKGNPPCIGWYNASAVRLTGAWRWWDGKCWSECAFVLCSPREAAYLAKTPENGAYPIEWTTYWPKNARVPDTRNLKGYK